MKNFNNFFLLYCPNEQLAHKVRTMTIKNKKKYTELIFDACIRKQSGYKIEREMYAYEAPRNILISAAKVDTNFEHLLLNTSKISSFICKTRVPHKNHRGPVANGNASRPAQDQVKTKSIIELSTIFSLAGLLQS